jgi:hypothetical protein
MSVCQLGLIKAIEGWIARTKSHRVVPSDARSWLEAEIPTRLSGIGPPLSDCTDVPWTLASAMAGCIFACTRFRGSGRGIKRAGRGFIWPLSLPFQASSRGRALHTAA